MKPRTFVTAFLLLFALGSAAMIFFPASAIAPRLPSENVLPDKPANRVIAYYFYGKVRCTTCRTVHPPGRYGVSSCASVSLATAAESFLGSSAIVAIAACRSASLRTGTIVNLPTGYRRSMTGI